MNNSIAKEGNILIIQGVECYEKDGIAYLNLEAVARGLGFTYKAASGNEVVRWNRLKDYLGEIGFIATSGDGETLPNFIPENVFYRLCMKAKNAVAEAFQAKVADEIIPALSKWKQLDKANLPKTFSHESFGDIRTLEKDGEPWFVAVDVCRALDISNNRQAVERLDDDEKSAVSLTDVSQNGVTQYREMSIVNEPGLYSLVLGSRKPEAKAFKRWITHEVIPAIRKHGMYMTPNTLKTLLADPNAFAALANQYAEEYNARMAAEKKLEEQAPKVLFADSVSDSPSCVLIGELAKILKQNGVPVGQNRLFQRLRNDGFLVSRKGTDYNMPTQYSMERGLMIIKETQITHKDGHITISKTPKVTGKGQVFFVNRYASN